MHFYAYVGNGPADWFDPFGLQKHKPRKPPKPPVDPCPKEKEVFLLLVLDVSEVLFLCEQHSIDVVIIATEVEEGER